MKPALLPPAGPLDTRVQTTPNGHQPEEALSLSALVESLLFVADEPVPVEKLAQALQVDPQDVENALQALGEEYIARGRGLRLLRREGRVQLVTHPAAAQAVEDFLNLDLTTRLSGPALEVLSIIAYRQPVTRAQIEAVRGVDCSGVLRKLLQLGLVEEVDRLDAPGRPIRYGVTDQFFHYFGLTGLDDLPPLPPEDAARLDEALAAGLEERASATE